MKRILSLLLCLALILPLQTGYIQAETTEDLTILFTHDVHDYFYPTRMIQNGVSIEHGGAARLATLLKNNSNDHSIYVDAGDFSMGTLLQAAYSTDALELRILGKLGCKITTFGNHEFDYGAEGVSKMLRAAVASGEVVPKLVCSNASFEGELTADQKLFQAAMKEYGVLPYTIEAVGNHKVAFFGLLGEEAVKDSPTSGQVWEEYIEAAKRTVSEIGSQADIIVCLSHSGTTGDGVNGEDFDLVKKVPEIDVIVSGHSHSTYEKPVIVGDTVIVSAGEYLKNLGKLNLTVSNGKVSVSSYELLPINSSVPDDPEMAEIIAGYQKQVEASYLKDEQVTFDQIIATSDFDFMALSEMYATHQEYPMGDLIADAYLYEANRQGITDIDVALVGLGTIRGTFTKGDISVSDVFEKCSLGVGSDGSAGHPILTAYITGKELKLLTELDASLGPMVSSIKMSYAGLNYTFNTKRVILDRVTEVYLVRPDGSHETIEDKKLYKVCCNLYAANMLGMLNGLTKGILKITPKYSDGKVITDLASCAMINREGKEIKEWVALKNFLMSFDAAGSNTLPTIPAAYKEMQNRKVKVAQGGFAILKNPGVITLVVFGVPTLLVILIIYLCLTRKKRKAKKTAKKAAKLAKKESADNTPNE